MSFESIWHTYATDSPKGSVPDIVDGLRQTAEYLIPTYATRLPTTAVTSMLPLIPIALMTIMAGLARTPNTQPLRLAFLPIAVAVNLRACYGYFFEDPALDGFNHILRTLGVMNPAWFAFLALSRDGALKMNEIAPGVLKPEPKKEGAEAASTPQQPKPFSIGTFLSEGLALVGNLRGIGYKHGTGTGVYVSKETRDLSSKSAFLRDSVLQLAYYYITTDITNSILTWFGLRQLGGTIFGHGRNPVESFAISTFLTLVTCIWMTQIINFIQTLVSTITILLSKDTGLALEDAGWGKLMVAPWAATSLHDFWGVRWHQVIRLHLLALGGYPLSVTMRAIAQHLPIPMSPKTRQSFAKQMGNAGLVCGTFFASAFIHNYSIAPTIDPETGLVPNKSGIMGAPTIIYFSIQALGIGMEKVWKGVMGRPVGGYIGMAWVSLWIIGAGQFLWDSWHNRRFQPGLAIPPNLSLTETYIVPHIRALLK